MEIHVRASRVERDDDPDSFPLLGVGSAPAYTITKLGGAALAVGDIAGNLHELILRYNLANTRWELVNPKTSNQSGSGTLDATDFTGNISLTGAEINEAAVSIASATTTSIWTANANYLTLTGTATITSFGTSVQAGARRRVTCSSAPYLDQFRQSHLPRQPGYSGPFSPATASRSRMKARTSRGSRATKEANVFRSVIRRADLSISFATPRSMSGSGVRRAPSPQGTPA